MSASTVKPTIYLPVEIKARELKAKVLLAMIAAQHGFRTYLGSKRAIDDLVERKAQKGGIYFYKGGKPAAAMQRIKQKTDLFVVLDEEMGPAVQDLDHYYQGRIHPGTEEQVERLFLIGQSHLESLQRVRPALAGKAVVTGWPRIDLWRPDFKQQFSADIASIKERYGDFLLFSSDFGIVSDTLMKRERERLRAGDFREEIRQRFLTQLDHAYADFRECLDRLRDADADPGFPPIVVRPHPSEDIATWKDALAGLKKTKVVFEGEISPWLYASRGLLHRGCTTAVQAYFAGIPSIYILGTHSPPKTNTLPYRMAHIAPDYACAKELAQALFLGRLGIKPDVGSLSEIHIEEKLASVRIVEELENLSTEPEPRFEQPLLATVLRHLHGRIGELRASIGIGPQKRRLAKMQRKTPGGIHADEIRSIASGLFPEHEMTIREISFNAVMIDAPLLRKP